MSSILKILRRIGGAKVTPTAGDEGQLAVWKAGKTTTDAVSLFFHDGVQWVELLDTSRNPRVITANDANPGLRITQTGSGPVFLAEDEANPDTSPFVVEANGFVGINKRNPTHNLDVFGTGMFTLSDTSYNNMFELKNDNNGSGSAALAFSVSSSASSEADVPKASIALKRQGAQGTGPLIFCVNGLTNADRVAEVDEKMRIMPGGNVGIGATAPSAKLHITQMGTEPALLVEDEASPDNSPFIVDSKGFVGINRKNPEHNLDVFGTARISIVDPNYNNMFELVNDNNGAGSAALAFNVASSASSEARTPKASIALKRQGAQGTGPFIFCLRAAADTGVVTDADEMFRINTSGMLTSLPSYTITGGGIPLTVDSSGNFMRTSSSQKYKRNIEPLDHAIADNVVKNLRPVWYRRKEVSGDVKADWSHIGLIAEEVEKVEKRLVHYKTKEVTFEGGDRVVTELATPTPEDVDYARLSVILLDYVQRLEKRVAALEARP